MNRPFPYYRLYWQEFENVTIEICREILGIAAKKFADGIDGGRDSKFEGTATKFPSDKDPWNGVFIIQAKHTSELNSSCSDNVFSSNSKNSIISQEIKRLKKLKEDDPFNNYLLFTNRKLTAGTHNSIKKRIKNEVQVKNVELFGIEGLDSHITSDIIFKMKLNESFTPLRIFEKDIQEVILAFNNVLDDIIIIKDRSFFKISIEEKNELNQLSKQYFKFINNNSLQHFYRIRTFLSMPRNSQYLNFYQNTVNDLQAKIILNRSDYHLFDLIIEEIVGIIVDKYENRMKDCRRLARSFVHYMYYNCDIGQNDQAE